MKSAAIYDGRSYYHPKCYKTKQAVKEIAEYYTNNVDKSVVHKLLYKTVNTLVFEKGVDAELLCFALKYAHQNNWKIESPLSLHYIAKDKKAEQAFMQQQGRRSINMNNSITTEFDFTEHEPQIPVKKHMGFDEILSAHS
jgi:hypothetical protein